LAAVMLNYSLSEMHFVLSCFSIRPAVAAVAAAAQTEDQLHYIIHALTHNLNASFSNENHV